MPPTYFLIGLVLVAASRLLLGAFAYISPATVAVGGVLLAAGIALNLLADSAFKTRGTPVNPAATPSTLVASGAFRVTRNPMYLGMALIVAAAALLVGEPVGVVFALALVAIFDRIFVPGEERRLESAFGGAYADYKRVVRRWV